MLVWCKAGGAWLEGTAAAPVLDGCRVLGVWVVGAAAVETASAGAAGAERKEALDPQTALPASSMSGQALTLPSVAPATTAAAPDVGCAAVVAAAAAVIGTAADAPDVGCAAAIGAAAAAAAPTPVMGRAAPTSAAADDITVVGCTIDKRGAIVSAAGFGGCGSEAFGASLPLPHLRPPPPPPPPPQ